jgi:hypothetical protein
MDYNLREMKQNIPVMREYLRRLEEAVDSRSMDDIHTSLADLTGMAITCRGRLQFMRGVWRVLMDMRGESAME